MVVEVAAGRKPLPTDPALVGLLPAVDPPAAQTELSQRLVYPLSQGLPQDDPSRKAITGNPICPSTYKNCQKNPPSTLTPRGSYRKAKIFTVQL